VPDEHQCDAKIVILGEAGGEQESESGLPFVGPSGSLLNRLLEAAGLSRQEVYVDNVVPFRPNAHNDIKAVPFEELQGYEQETRQRLQGVFTEHRPNVIVPLGNTALRALTGFGGIQKWRGSILAASKLGDGRKAIGTLHPAFLLRQPGLTKTALFDWKRIKAESKYPELRLPNPAHIIFPKREEIEWFIGEAEARPEQMMSIDIENNRRDLSLICVGFALSEDLSITLEWSDVDYIKYLCELPNPKVIQNGFFDMWHLNNHRIYVKNFLYDPSCMFHCLDPAAGPNAKGKGEGGESSRIKAYGLAYMASIKTRFPYWKDEAKEDNEGTIAKNTPEWRAQFRRYNGKDCVAEWALANTFLQELTRVGLLETYHKLYANLYGPLYRLMRRGVSVDVKGMEVERGRLEIRLVALKAEIAAQAGKPLHSTHVGATWYRCEKCSRPGKVARHKKAVCPKGGATERIPPIVTEGVSLSTKLLKEYLYGSKEKGNLGFKRKVKKGTVTTDEAALRGLRLQYPEAGILANILEFRRTEKLASFLGTGHIDKDGRCRSQYKQLVQTGRLSSASNPSGTGMNLQNTDATLMYLFKPDAGKFFLRADLSQAEDRVVKVLTGVPRLVEEARSMPWELDVHTRNAASLFDVPEDKVTKEQRYLGKRVKHASNYGMTAMKLAEIIAKDSPKVGITRAVTLKECDELLKRAVAITPEITGSYQRAIRDIIRGRGILSNSWGARIDLGVEYRFANGVSQREEIFRKGYAWIPQGEVGRLMNQWGLVPLDEEIEHGAFRDSAINLQRHDELVVSVPRTDLWHTACFIRDSLGQPRNYSLGPGYPLTSLVIPVEFAVGIDGDKKHSIEWKRFPETQEQFEMEVDKWLSAL
jgi:uracil-DNA glycosylase family 4